MRYLGLAAIVVGCVAAIALAGCGGDLGYCGDGEVQSKHEQCDDGNLAERDTCLSTCELAVCGDGIVWYGHEECDNASANSDSVAGACRTDCKSARCGDGGLDVDEGCDDGNLSDDDACLSTCISATCGDGIVQLGVEECDDGAANHNMKPDACRRNCRKARCSDGAVDSSEQCDDGNLNDNDFCLATCAWATCGDGILWPGVEECDNGSANSDTVADACRLDCKLPRCGDGGVDTGETCDDGNDSDEDACLISCIPNVCGDGYLNSSAEGCEDGNQATDDSCVSCLNATCGDGFVRDGYEECDDGMTNGSAPNSCRLGCRLPRCGDGVVDAGEACDAGSLVIAMCDSDCTAPSCGDGVTNVAAAETCDDGNNGASDGCSPTCTIEPGWVVYVNVGATGANNGTSWTNAYTSLQDALAATSSGEIWVAQGTYYPDQGVGVTPDDPAATFQLKSNVALYGGFAASELARSQRIPSNVTRLSGWDGAHLPMRHVMTAQNVTNARIDRFSIERGSAADVLGGGGITIDSSTLTIADCDFRFNMREAYDGTMDPRGAALHGIASALTIERSRFESNHVYANDNQTAPQGRKAQGGAVYVAGGSLTLVDCAFSGNEVFSYHDAEGGAVYSAGAELRIVGTTFMANRAQGYVGDAAGRGGAIYIDNSTTIGAPSAVIYDSSLTDNETLGMRCWGGAVAVGPQTDLLIANTLLTSNETHCSAAGGSAVSAVGAGSMVDMRNCTVAHNGALNGGGALHVGDAASATVTNSVFWDYASGLDILVSPLATAAVTYSCVQSSGWGTGTQTLTNYPFTGAYRVSMTSSCIDAGSNSAVPPDVFDRDRDGDTTEPLPTDLAGRARFVRNVDCGAYEKQ